jgi:hypothetical protein
VSWYTSVFLPSIGVPCDSDHSYCKLYIHRFGTNGHPLYNFDISCIDYDYSTCSYNKEKPK